MRRKKKKKEEAVVLHQHRTTVAGIFGKAHPVTKKHSKKSTQKAHDATLELHKILMAV